MTVEIFNEQKGLSAQVSEGELGVLNLLAAGFSHREIADQIGFAERTIQNRLTELYGRLAVQSRLEAALLLTNGDLLNEQLVAQRLDLERFNSLGKRQRDILEILLGGHAQTKKQIAQTLGVPIGTVKSHLSQINAKLGVSDSMTRTGIVIGYWLYKQTMVDETAPSEHEDTFNLTARGIEMFRLAALGLGNHEVAMQLGIAYSTVKNRFAQTYGKLGVYGKEEVVAMLIKQKKLDPAELAGDFDLSTFDSLTPKQHRLIDALLEGSARQSTRTRTIAGRLGYAPSTVKNELVGIYQSLGINELTRSRTRLVALALAYKQQKSTDTGSGKF